LSPGVGALGLVVRVVCLFVVAAAAAAAAVRLDMVWEAFHWQGLVVKHLEAVFELDRRSLPARDCWERLDDQLRPWGLVAGHPARQSPTPPCVVCCFSRE
jgi:hypothetical protein